MQCGFGMRSHAVAGAFVAIFKRELGDAGFVEFAEAFGNHSIVLFLCGAGERQIEARHVDASWTALMRFECDRARAMLVAGKPLGRTLPGRVGLEIRATIEGGIMIADRITAASGDVFRHRPTLRKRDWAWILWRAAMKTGDRP